MTYLVTSGNASITAWLDSKGIKYEYFGPVTTSEALHRHLIGLVPVWLAAYATSVSEISMPRLSRMDRARFNAGQLTPAEMDAAGAQLVTYEVRRTQAPRP